MSFPLEQFVPLLQHPVNFAGSNLQPVVLAWRFAHQLIGGNQLACDSSRNERNPWREPPQVVSFALAIPSHHQPVLEWHERPELFRAEMQRAIGEGLLGVPIVFFGLYPSAA